MELAFRNEAVQRQVIRVSPQMRLASQIMRLPRTDLETLIDEQWKENPALDKEVGEIEGDRAEGSDGTGGDGGDEQNADSEREITIPATDSQRVIDWTDTYANDAHGSAADRRDRTGARDRWFQNLPTPTPSLANHLLQQLRLLTVSAAEQSAAALIIDSLEEDGYLRRPLEDVAFECGLDSDVVAGALRKIQELDPPGVGARDLRECLLLQLPARGAADSLAARIVRDHLELLASRSYDQLAHALAASVEDVVEAATHIVALEPKPGRNFGANDTQYIVPDVFVDKIAGEWVITLNDAGLPRLRLNNAYRLLAESSKGATHAYLKERVIAAEWFMKCVEHRNHTLSCVMRSILGLQRDFFEHGIARLKPLLQRTVAAEIKVHASTVSRATNDKYVRTPHGTLPLSFFFPSGVAGENREPVSSPRVQQRIRVLIGSEDPRQPLSDRQIVTRLADENIHVKRRTVAKYRNALGIPIAQERRTVHIGLAACRLGANAHLPAAGSNWPRATPAGWATECTLT